VPNVSNIRGRIIGGAINRATPSRADVQEILLDRLDPVRQVEKLSDYFLRRKRLADFAEIICIFTPICRNPLIKKDWSALMSTPDETLDTRLFPNPTRVLRPTKPSVCFIRRTAIACRRLMFWADNF
jgi:hypothetical protein